MGNESSTEREQRRERERKERLDRFVKQLDEGPDLRVNKSIVMFTSLSSSDNLRRHYEKRKMEADNCAADWTKSLVEKLGGFTSAPELAGLGALAIAVLIDIVSFSPSEESTKDALRCVFAEEKASEVWDQIDECLKRCMMHIKNKDKLRSDIERIECQLSAAITKLKSSMVRDGHMLSEALKAWVNGAAFHIQMLIHLVRLGGIQTCDPVERLLSAYLSDLDLLFSKHKEVIEGKCSSTISSLFTFKDVTFENIELIQSCTTFFVDENSKQYSIHACESNKTYFEAYYDHRYSRQKCEIQQYFRDVSQNLQKLVHQRGSFNVN